MFLVFLILLGIALLWCGVSLAKNWGDARVNFVVEVLAAIVGVGLTFGTVYFYEKSKEETNEKQQGVLMLLAAYQEAGNNLEIASVFARAGEYANRLNLPASVIGERKQAATRRGGGRPAVGAEESYPVLKKHVMYRRASSRAVVGLANERSVLRKVSPEIRRVLSVLRIKAESMAEEMNAEAQAVMKAAGESDLMWVPSKLALRFGQRFESFFSDVLCVLDHEGRVIGGVVWREWMEDLTIVSLKCAQKKEEHVDAIKKYE